MFCLVQYLVNCSQSPNLYVILFLFVFSAELLGNYGNLTEEEVDSVFQAIRGNLTYAEDVIDEGTMDTEDLQNIQAAFAMVGQINIQPIKATR